MYHIKLSAIGSTNDYLKALAAAEDLPNYVAVTADSQTNGRGQMGATWQSEAGKNLTMSLLVKDVLAGLDEIFTLNVAVAIAISDALNASGIPQLHIKWPNDILSGTKKVGGVLIENLRGPDGSWQSVVGIGINVNQTDFEALPSASSLLNVSGKSFDLTALMEAVRTEIIRKTDVIRAGKADALWDDYNRRIFRAGVVSTFEDTDGTRFSGIIKEVRRDGLLRVLLEDDTLRAFGIKEVKLLY